jgi:hypothetical protein
MIKKEYKTVEKPKKKSRQKYRSVRWESTGKKDTNFPTKQFFI